jgi:ABC transporter, permease protein
MGTVITQSIRVMDFPVVQAAVLLIAALVIVCNIASDILMAILDPRVREELK